MVAIIYTNRTANVLGPKDEAKTTGLEELFPARIFSSKEKFIATILREKITDVRVVIVDVTNDSDAEVAQFAAMILSADPNVLMVFRHGDVADFKHDIPGGLDSELPSEHLTFVDCSGTPESQKILENGSELPWSLHLSQEAHSSILEQLHNAQAWRKNMVKYRHDAVTSGLWPPMPHAPFSWIFCSEVVSVSDLVDESTVSRINGEIGQFESFDPHPYSENELVVAVYLMIHNILVGAPAKLTRASNHILWLALVMRACYCSNKYHNFRHAVDVLQSVYFQISRGLTYPSGKEISHEDRLGLLLAALGHDMFHPGVTVATLRTTRCALSKCHNSLESYHAKMFLGIVGALWPAMAEGSGACVIQKTIAATEMAKHKDYLVDFDDSERPGQYMWLAQLLKVADIANCARAFDISVQHSVDLALECHEEAELKEQGDLTTPKPAPNFTNSEWRRLAPAQVKFITLFVRPLFEKVANANKDNQILVDALNVSTARWEGIEQEENNRTVNV